MAAVFCAALPLCSCGGDNVAKKAEEMLEQAKGEFGSGHYEEALSTIDSLRKDYPTAVEARKAALKLYQEVELKRSQLSIEQADKALQKIEAEYNRMKATVDGLKEKGEATAAQLTAVTKMRMLRDSLRTVFDVQCAKARYIKNRMGE